MTSKINQTSVSKTTNTKLAQAETDLDGIPSGGKIPNFPGKLGGPTAPSIIQNASIVNNANGGINWKLDGFIKNENGHQSSGATFGISGNFNGGAPSSGNNNNLLGKPLPVINASDRGKAIVATLKDIPEAPNTQTDKKRDESVLNLPKEPAKTQRNYLLSGDDEKNFNTSYNIKEYTPLDCNENEGCGIKVYGLPALATKLKHKQTGKIALYLTPLSDPANIEFKSPK